MEIIGIFVKDYEGLYSIKYPGCPDNEFERLFELWNDREYLLNFCLENKDDIFTDFWGTSKLEDFVEEIIDEAYELEKIFLEYSENEFLIKDNMLQTIFKPLNNNEYSLPVLQLSKAKVDNHRYFKKPKLRLYALRLNENTFILTGGCIKLVHKMDESAHTLQELGKLTLVKNHLKSKGITTSDDLSYYYEQE
jgi:hypothetical protein